MTLMYNFERLVESYSGFYIMVLNPFSVFSFLLNGIISQIDFHQPVRKLLKIPSRQW